MASLSLKRWNTDAVEALDRMEMAHRAIGGAARGRRYATQQINQSYLMLLSSHFQRFCRDLHSEATDHLLGNLDPTLGAIVRGVLTTGRKLDQGNPNAGNIGADFGRLGMSFWPSVKARDRHYVGRFARLESLARWRNAIAHQDFVSHAQALNKRTEVTLQEVRGFRRACSGLARHFDGALLAHIKAVVGPKGGW
jgi:hypothetical protein